LENALKTGNDQKLEQFDALLNHDMVEAIGISDGNLLIKTKHLTMTNPDDGEEKDLGEFEIMAPISSRHYRAIEARNATNAKYVDGTTYHHPHVTEGTPCFGAFESTILDALASGEYVGALEYMLQFLQTVNPEDSYFDHWHYF
jgi:hypothetical protein